MAKAARVSLPTSARLAFIDSAEAGELEQWAADHETGDQWAELLERRLGELEARRKVLGALEAELKLELETGFFGELEADE
jgi:hypothetical protein